MKPDISAYDEHPCNEARHKRVSHGRSQSGTRTKTDSNATVTGKKAKKKEKMINYEKEIMKNSPAMLPPRILQVYRELRKTTRRAVDQQKKKLSTAVPVRPAGVLTGAVLGPQASAVSYPFRPIRDRTNAASQAYRWRTRQVQP